MKATVHLFLTGPLSQWHAARFEVDGIAYNCAEQFMMHKKALLFGDQAMAARILAAAKPHDQKRMGAAVKGFVEETWRTHRVAIVTTGNWAKFSQNEGLKRRLLQTGDAILAEANPRDAIWGIALAADDPRAQDPAQWQGENLLGQILMDVRAKLAREASRRKSS